MQKPPVAALEDGQQAVGETAAGSGAASDVQWAEQVLLATVSGRVDERKRWGLRRNAEMVCLMRLAMVKAVARSRVCACSTR